MDVLHMDRGIPVGMLLLVYENVIQMMMSTSADYCRALVFFACVS